MTSLRVDPRGLDAFAASCAEDATTLRSALVVDGNSGPRFQATSTAVTVSDSKIDAACTTLAERIEDLSAKLASAAEAYRGRDQGSAMTVNRAGDRIP
jgi:uncharacterized protein YukE